MSDGVKHFAILYVPRSGLFFSGGEFMNGRQERVPWRRVIPLFTSHSAACVARDKLKEKWKQLDANFIVVAVELRVVGGGPVAEMLEEE